MAPGPQGWIPGEGSKSPPVQAENNWLKNQNTELEAFVTKLEARVAELEKEIAERLKRQERDHERTRSIEGKIDGLRVKWNVESLRLKARVAELDAKLKSIAVQELRYEGYQGTRCLLCQSYEQFGGQLKHNPGCMMLGGE